MQEIKKSHADRFANFEVEVAKFVSLKKEWKIHQAKVDDDNKNGVTGIDQHVAYPHPRAHAQIESAIDAEGNAAYRIVDDGPTPEQVLEQQKLNLEQHLQTAETAAIEAIFPRRQLPLLSAKENDINAAHQQSSNRGVIKSLLASPPEMPSDDKAFVEQMRVKRQKIADIRRITAQALADIDGLTAKTIGAWKLPSFS